MNRLGRRKVVGVAGVLIIALLFVPFPTQLSPDFTVRFVDDVGNPIAGMEVQRTCTHYTYDSLKHECPEDWDHPPKTDSDGKVSFSAKYVWYGVASRAMRAGFSYMMLIAHGSVGRSVVLFPRQPKGFKDVGWFTIDLDNPQTEIIMRRK